MCSHLHSLAGNFFHKASSGFSGRVLGTSKASNPSTLAGSFYEASNFCSRNFHYLATMTAMGFGFSDWPYFACSDWSKTDFGAASFVTHP